MTFVRQLLAVRDGRAETLKVGDVSSRRDFVDVRDAVGALDTLLYRGEPGSVHNVGSGRDTSVREIIDELMEISGVRPPVTVEATRMRPADVPVVRAQVSKMRDTFGWQTRISLGSSLAAMWTDAAAGAGNAEEGE
jgi:nucleoside-diphosphate-sugar epimerase